MIKINKKLLFLSLFIASIILFLPEKSFAKALADQVRDPTIIHLWQITLGIVNIAAILGLIAIAFANILRVQVETYNIRRMLPTLILAIIFANLSHLLCRIGIDFAQIFTSFFIYANGLFSIDITYSSVAKAFGLAGIGDQAVINGGGGIITALTGFLVTGLAFGFLTIVIMALIIIMLPSLLVLLIALLMYVRLYIIWFLVILSPLAFFAAFFEPLKMLWSTWWNWFLKWLFMAPVAFFFLRLAVEVGNRSHISEMVQTSTIDSGATTAVSSFAVWIFALGMIFFAIYVPFTWGQNVYGALKGMATNAWAGRGVLSKARQAQGLLLKKRGEKLLGSKNRFVRGAGKIMRGTGKAQTASLGPALEAKMKEIEEESQIATYESRILGKRGLAGSKAESAMYQMAGDTLREGLPTPTLEKIAQMKGVNTDNLANLSTYREGEIEKYYADTYRGRLAYGAEHGDTLALTKLIHGFQPYIDDPTLAERENLSNDDKAWVDLVRRSPEWAQRRTTPVRSPALPEATPQEEKTVEGTRTGTTQAPATPKTPTAASSAKKAETPKQNKGGSAPSGGDLSKQIGAVRQDINAIKAGLKAQSVPEGQIEARARELLARQEKKEAYKKHIAGYTPEKPKTPPSENK